MRQKETVRRATVGFALSLTSGILTLIQGIIRIVRSQFLIDLGFDMLRRRFFGETALTVVGIVGIVFGILIITGALLIYNPKTVTAGGIIVLVFSIFSFLSGGGFVIGMILGIVGGALGLAKL